MLWVRSYLPALAAATLSLSALAGCSDDVTAEASEDPYPPELGGPAQGISITEIELNQGTGVLAASDGAWLASDARNAYLVRDRDTLVRVQHVIDDPDQWVPRNLTGFIHIILPGGDEIVRAQERFIEADSEARDLTSGFFFSVLAEEAQPGASMWIELRESDKAIDVSGLSTGVATLPEQPESFGFETTPLEMKVVIVPVQYNHYDPPTIPDITDDDLALFRDDMLQQNPLQTVDISFRDEPLVRDTLLTNLGELLGPTRELKIADEAAPNVYYHALIDVKGSSVSMVAGIAWLTDATKSDGDRRVAATVFHKHVDPGDPEEGEEPTVFAPAASSRTWVHEVGHNQGFSHVACPAANAAGPDPSYPYESGKIGVYGFGIRNFHLYTPGAAHDYMSYCGNSWVSDWTWNKAYERIATLTSWDYEGPSAQAEDDVRVRRPIVVGMLFADGSEDWWLLEDFAPREPSGSQSLEFWSRGELLASEYADVEYLSDGETVVVTAPLPVGTSLAEIDGITRFDHGLDQGLDLARRPVDLDRLHVGRTLR